MTVYVDNMRANFGQMIMCHMIATDVSELHAMADRIGIQRRWFQGDHYDISLSKRALAVAAGAVEISWKQCGCMAMVVRMGLPMPKPEVAEEDYIFLRYLIRFYDLNRANSFECDSLYILENRSDDHAR